MRVALELDHPIPQVLERPAVDHLGLELLDHRPEAGLEAGPSGGALQLLVPLLGVLVPPRPPLGEVGAGVLVLGVPVVVGDVQRLDQAAEQRAQAHPLLPRLEAVRQFAPPQHLDDLVPEAGQLQPPHVGVEVVQLPLELEGIIVAYAAEFACSFVVVQGSEGFLDLLAAFVNLRLVSLSLLLPLRSCRKVQYSFLAL